MITSPALASPRSAFLSKVKVSADKLGSSAISFAVLPRSISLPKTHCLALTILFTKALSELTLKLASTTSFGNNTTSVDKLYSLPSSSSR